MTSRVCGPAGGKPQRCPWLASAALLAGLLGALPVRAEPLLPAQLFPFIADPFAADPSAQAPPPGVPPPLLSPDTPPAPIVPPLVRMPPLGSVLIPRAEAANCVRRDSAGRFMGWMDHQHCVYSGRTLATARWLDDFFGDWHDDEASMMLRLISQTVIEESEGASMRVSVRASADLPNARRRLRLIVSDDSDPEEALGGEPGSRQRREDTQSSAALRWIPAVKHWWESAIDLGVRGVDPPDFFIRARGRRSWGLTEDSILRLAQTLRYGSESRERSVSQVDLERALDSNSVLRLGSTYDYFAERNSEGFVWTHALSLSHALRRSRSLSYGFAVNGHTQPNWRGESLGPWVAYRRSFLRPYLFVELEPRYTWFREFDWDGRVSTVLRLEMQFGLKR